MECSYNIEIDIDGSPDLYTKKIVTARKEHKCYECGRVVITGEQYESVRGKWEGDFETYKTCTDCLSLRDTFFNDGWGFGDIWWDFSDTLNDWDYDVPESCIAALTPAAREKVCQIIEDGWEKD